jgi:hypothetical protein
VEERNERERDTIFEQLAHAIHMQRPYVYLPSSLRREVRGKRVRKRGPDELYSFLLFFFWNDLSVFTFHL